MGRTVSWGYIIQDEPRDGNHVLRREVAVYMCADIPTPESVLKSLLELHPRKNLSRFDRTTIARSSRADFGRPL